MHVEHTPYLHTQKSRTRNTLHVLVFESRPAKLAATLLFSFLLIQPLSLAYAAEEHVDSTDEQTLEEIIIEAEIQSVPDTLDLELEPATNSEESQNTETVVVGENLTTAPADESGANPESFDEPTSMESLENTTLQEGGVESVEEVPATESDDVSEGDLSELAATTTLSATTTEEDLVLTVDDPVEPNEPLATTTPTTTLATTTEEVTSHNASAFSFDTTQCAVVGEGSYYCNEKKALADYTEDGVFSAQDSDGDLEIYMKLKGETVQITHNTTDDASPYYDSASQRVVWHSVNDDRYQIMSRVLGDNESMRITNASYNNMEPVAYGELTLWQAWIDNNWEIILYDGQSQRQLTNNTHNDVSPHMKDGYIVWQAQFEDGWQVAVYDEKTKEISYIGAEGGLTVENPRFVLVYDSTDAQGDRRTVGYDFDSKSSFNLGVLPQELPEELPEPDQTGETRALLQNKSQGRESGEEVLEIHKESEESGTSTDLHTLDLTATSSQQGASSTVGNLVDVPDIEDLVIPPFVATSTDDVR